LNGTAPTQLGSLSNLQVLALNNNQLSGSIPTQLANLHSLTTLNLATNSWSCPVLNYASLAATNDYATEVAQCVPPPTYVSYSGAAVIPGLGTITLNAQIAFYASLSTVDGNGTDTIGGSFTINSGGTYNYQTGAVSFVMNFGGVLYTVTATVLPNYNLSGSAIDSSSPPGSFAFSLKPTKTPSAAAPIYPIYIGCYADSSPRALSGLAANSIPDLTPQWCNNYCQGYTYFGLQTGQCHCGSGNYALYGPSSSCTSPCSGNSAVMCGGSWTNSVYYTGAPIAGFPHPTPIATGSGTGASGVFYYN